MKKTTMSRMEITELARNCSLLSGESLYPVIYDAILPQELLSEQAADKLWQGLLNRSDSENIRLFTIEARKFEGTLFLISYVYVDLERMRTRNESLNKAPWASRSEKSFQESK